MKQFRYISLAVCLIYILSLTFLPGYAVSPDTPTAQLPVGANAKSCHGMDATMSMLGADLGLKDITSAFLYEAKSETLMYAMNADQKMYPSSLAKILTTLIAVERGNPEDMVTVKEEVLNTVPYDAVSAKLQPEEVISLRDLLYCMMVGSANDAAAVIADHISGDQESFVQLMNEYARTYGCTATNFTNAHGLHNEEQYTTARDMARILSAAVKNVEFNNYYATVRYKVPATNKSEQRNLSSNNFLMNSDNMQIYYDPRVTGGRIGTADDGTRCLAISAENEDMQLLCVVMGAESVYADDGYTVDVFGGFKEVSTLFDSGFNGFKLAQVLFPNQAIKQQKVLNGDSDVVLGAKSAAYVILPEGVSTKDLDYKLIEKKSPEAPVRAGEVLSQIQIWNGSICVAESDLFAMNSVSLISEQSVSENNQEESTGFVITLIVVLVVLLVAAVLVFRYLPVLRSRIRHKNYRKARRRSR